jgi:exonuclease SbcC
VRDLLNEGRTRAVKTLSGGQKFQVALCLALALADNIHAQTQSTNNFFFLDEGFGSLDKDSLTEVFETLKSLRKENRIVGVISRRRFTTRNRKLYHRRKPPRNGKPD